MIKKILVALLVALSIIPLGVAMAADPAELAYQILAAQNYKVINVGKVANNHVYVSLGYSPANANVAYYADEPSNTTTLNNLFYQHAIDGYKALREAYPQATTMSVVVIINYIARTFTTDGATFDRSELSGASQAAFKVNQLAKARGISLITTTGSPTVPQPTSKPPQASGDVTDPCAYYSHDLTPGKAVFWVRNQYTGSEMTFTIGTKGGGTDDYKIPGDREWYWIEFTPGRMTYTATIAGRGQAGSGAPQNYGAGDCGYADFRG